MAREIYISMAHVHTRVFQLVLPALAAITLAGCPCECRPPSQLPPSPSATRTGSVRRHLSALQNAAPEALRQWFARRFVEYAGATDVAGTEAAVAYSRFRWDGPCAFRVVEAVSRSGDVSTFAVRITMSGVTHIRYDANDEQLTLQGKHAQQIAAYGSKAAVLRAKLGRLITLCRR